MIYFIVYLFLETLVSVSISSSIGGILTFVEIIISGIVGLLLLQNLPYSISESFLSLKSGQIDADDFKRMNLSVLFGAFLLIIPGFLTDIIGILLQFESFATIIAKKFIKDKQNINNKGE